MKKKLARIWLFILQKWLIIPIIAAFFVAVALVIPRFSRFPTQADDGQRWDRQWEMLGTVLGVEAPQNGLTLLNNNTVLAGDDTYYASWVCGEAVPYVNAEGKDVDLYPAQVYLLLYGCTDEASAQTALHDFMSREMETYAVRHQQDATYNGQAYTLLLYDCPSASNPYSCGISAFLAYGRYAVVAELTCTDSFSGDEEKMLAEFLDGCHYSAEYIK